MDEKNKGLAENYDQEFILNESGTSVDNDMDEAPANDPGAVHTNRDELNEEKSRTYTINDPVLTNDIASDERSMLREDTIKPYDDVFPDHKAYEDNAEVSGTDDV
jgi:hypothetical protein